jgi:transposase-like protein
MGRTHPSTPEQRVQWASQMLVHAHEYGFVTDLSRTIGVSRPTLYAWKMQAHQALEQTFLDTTLTTVLTPALERQILTLLVEGHNSYSNIQTCLMRLTGQRVSIGTIGAVVHEAQQRALDWMASHAPASPRTLALDEIYATNRRGAYLHVVDTSSWAVWAAEGPLAVDSESWTLLLWLAQERGLRWHATVSDGGAAIQAACQIVDPHGQHGRDVWHVFHTWSQIQQRLERRLGRLQARTARVERQAARIAAGQKPRGHHPRSDVSAHLGEVRHAQRTVDDLKVLGQELQRLLAVVVLDHKGVVSRAQREQDVDSLVDLLAELHTTAPSAVQAELKRLHTHLRLAQGALLTFVAPLEAVHQAMCPVVGPDGVALIAWAWLHRALLAWDTEHLVAFLPQAWRAAARVLIHAWETATRASSAVENWHSILRPHLAVHRTLSAGLLALLAVWHNHRIFTRGVHKGHSPLHLSGMGEAPSDWLVALGYPPALTHALPTRVPLGDLAMAA